jgi:uncharacterized membrane protein YkvA (DUF1232 family)
MTDVESRCLEAFPEYLRSLGDDARAFAAVVESEDTSEPVRRHAAAALVYLFKSLDLIPDGIEDLGFIDDAFVFRAAASFAKAEGGSAEVIARLAADNELVKEFLGADHARLETYVRGLGTSSARGRSVEEVVKDAGARRELTQEVRAWADSYAVPGFTRDAKNLVKLKSFLTTKLPS